VTALQRQARALGDPTRHQIFRYVADAGEPTGVAELTAHFGLNHNAIRQHVAKLVTAGLVREERAPAVLLSGGQERPVTKALTAPQIVALLKEIASTEAAKNLDANKPATMSHVTGDGAFVIRAMLHGTKWHVNARIDDKAEFKRLTGQFKAMDLPPAPPTRCS